MRLPQERAYELFGQILPASAAAQNPQNAFEHLAVGHAWPSAASPRTWTRKQGPDLLPLGVGQQTTVSRHRPSIGAAEPVYLAVPSTQLPQNSAFAPSFETASSHKSPVIKRCIIPPVNILLNEVECRVLGSLIEKEITTPEYYPLSLNALVNACNQKSNRDPVMNLDEAAVRRALHSLDGQSLVRYVSAADSRVTKYEHRLQEAFNFYRHEVAILCVLLLRGPQTPGELRTRAERMHPFDDLGAVQSSLQHL